MAGSGILHNTGRVVEFVVKFVIKLTAKLVVELLKFAALTLIVLGVLFGSVLSFLCAVRWSYVASGGDVVCTLCVTMGMALTVLVVLAGLQYLVKDVLVLTNMTLLEFVFLWLKPAKKDNDNCCNGTLSSRDGKATDSETEKKSL